jgi:hypothetical protein
MMHVIDYTPINRASCFYVLYTAKVAAFPNERNQTIVLSKDVQLTIL